MTKQFNTGVKDDTHYTAYWTENSDSRAQLLRIDAILAKVSCPHPWGLASKADLILSQHEVSNTSKLQLILDTPSSPPILSSVHLTFEQLPIVKTQLVLRVHKEDSRHSIKEKES